jgi:hypothetical protein
MGHERAKNIYKSVRIIKQWVLRCPPEKRERNKIAHTLKKAFIKRERVMIQRSTKIFRIRIL